MSDVGSLLGGQAAFNSLGIAYNPGDDRVVRRPLQLLPRLYDEEPEWDAPLDSIAYVDDSERFPRDEQRQPEWLKAMLAEGRARLAARDR